MLFRRAYKIRDWAHRDELSRAIMLDPKAQHQIFLDVTTSIEDIERWRYVASEDEHLEFKRAERSYDFEKVLDYCVALANERGGKLVLGITNNVPRHVVGTTAFSNAQDLREKLFNALHRRIEVEEVAHPDGRILVLHVPSRPVGLPLERDGRYLMRVGENLVSMTPDSIQRILAEAQPDYTAEVASAADLGSLLESSAIEQFRSRWIQKSRTAAIGALSSEQLLRDAGLITNQGVTLAALILLGSKEAVSRSLPQSEVVFEYRSSETSTAYQQRLEFRQGFLGFQDELWTTINLRNDRQSYQDGLFRLDIPTFDETVVREAILNAVSHRDYRLGGSVFIRQYPRRLEIVSPGGFPPGITAENVLDRQVPRNRKLAEAFQLCGLVERSGQGMNRMFEESIKQGKQIPDFNGTDAYQVSVSLRGEVQHPAFVRFLEKLGKERVESFSTQDFLVLDYVHRAESVPEPLLGRVSRLLDVGAIERAGRRKLLLSRAMYGAMGQRGVYTRRKGLDHKTQKELLLQHLRENARDGSPLSELMQVLPQVGDRKVQTLLGELRSEGRVEVRGTRRWARWYLAQPKQASSEPDQMV